MNSQKKMTKNNNNSNAIDNKNFIRKPRRSIKAEGLCLNGMLRDGLAKVIDASKLGKRLSSEIWNSFGAIQVEDNFSNPSIDTKTVADGTSTLKICQFFVACSKCFSVFKYDGHAYGTTGLVKHVKICQGTNQRGIANPTSCITTTTTTTSNNTTTNTFDQNIDNTHTSSSSVAINNNATSNLASNGPVTTRRKRAEPTTASSRSRQQSQPSLRHLARVIEELRCEQGELKQKVHEMINLLGGGTGYVGQIQIISNDGDKVVEDELQKTD